MDTKTLKEILQRAMEVYSGEGLNGRGYLAINENECFYVVASVYYIRGEHFADAGLIARIEGNRIIIDLDRNNKILLDALLQADVPREQIVLAYAGEPVEEPV